MLYDNENIASHCIVQCLYLFYDDPGGAYPWHNTDTN